MEGETFIRVVSTGVFLLLSRINYNIPYRLLSKSDFPRVILLTSLLDSFTLTYVHIRRMTFV